MDCFSFGDGSRRRLKYADCVDVCCEEDVSFDVPIIEGEVEAHKGFLELSAILGGAYEYTLYIISWDWVDAVRF